MSNMETWDETWDASTDDRAAGVLAALSDAILVTDAEGRILRANAAAERMLGRTSDDVAGATMPYDFWPVEDAERMRAFVEMCRRSTEVTPAWAELAYVHSSGRRIPIRLTVCGHGSYTLHIAAARLDTTAGPGEDPVRRRIAVLERGLRHIAWELQALGVSVPMGVGSRHDSLPPEAIRNLSARQREVLDAFLDGHSVAATAVQLHVSEHTVRSHLKGIYRKLGVRSKTELVRRLSGPPGA